MDKLFRDNETNPPIPKNMPPKSGSIAWARSIITRIKNPIDKFKTKPEILMTPEGQSSASEYVRLAKHLTETHEATIFTNWKTENTSEAIKFLKWPILMKTGTDENRKYKVNFNPKLKVIIREAKFLDRIGKEIVLTFLNLESSSKAPSDELSFSLKVASINVTVSFSMLSIPEFIRECQDGIESFKETKGRVLQHANNIEKKVQNIENAVLVKTINFAS